jgi:hypothetical protein
MKSSHAFPWQTTLSLLALGAAMMAGCVAQSDPSDDSGDPAGQSSVSQSISGRYCIDQSTASVELLGSDPQFLGCGTPSWNSQYSRNHPVNVHIDCGTYVIAKDLWGTQYLILRQDALTPC